MPQTAFSATGAGVKSSVLFLRKHKDKQTEKISNQKAKLKLDVKTDNKYIATVEKWEKEKAIAIKNWKTKPKPKTQKRQKKKLQK
jgi:type I restriction enzyme M protein